MFFWLKYVKSLLETLNAETSPEDIAGGFVLGAVFGLIPKANFIGLLFWFIFWIFRINKGMAGAALLIFAVIGHFTDPAVEPLGYAILTAPALQSLWTALYNIPFATYTGFNQTLVMGNLAFGLLLAAPLFFAVRHFVPIYQVRYRERVLRSKVVQALNITEWINVLERWRQRR